MGSMINSIPKMFRRMNDGISGRMKWMKIVSNSQTIPVKEVHFNATEIEICQIYIRKKKNTISHIFYFGAKTIVGIILSY